MGILTLSPPHQLNSEVEIDLVASKSISNRLLLMQALSDSHFPIHNLAQAKDTLQLQSALRQIEQEKIQSGQGGTTYRFMTAYLALTGKPIRLEAGGSMKTRPVGPLVEALRKLGAKIEYAAKEGCPPLIFKAGNLSGGSIRMSASESSQYISALMMIAPKLEGGLKIIMEGPINSLPYIQMTAKLMRRMGINVFVELPVIEIPQQSYETPKEGISVESDWSGASYFWALSSLFSVEKTLLKGLQKESVQGDSIIVEWAKEQGFKTCIDEQGLHLIKTSDFKLNWTDHLDLNEHPDLAQTILTLYACAAKPIEIIGLQTLFHKETNRLKAMKQELHKIDVPLRYSQQGNAILNSHPGLASDSQVVFDTYQDHRMAMALSLLASRQRIKILSPEVVQKSFPSYWTEFSKYGFTPDPPLPKRAL